MKKIILIAGILSAGVTSANTITPKKGNDKNSQNEKVIVSKNKGNSNLKAKKLRQVDCVVFYASCTSAYTCQDWTPAQWQAWGNEIQQNYCQLW